MSEAYLLPDDEDAAPLEEYLIPHKKPEGLTAERAALQDEINFFSIRPGAHKLPEIGLERTSGGTYTFRTLE